MGDAGDVILWGAVPRIIEMESEAGAAGVLHAALNAGSRATAKKGQIRQAAMAMSSSPGWPLAPRKRIPCGGSLRRRPARVLANGSCIAHGVELRFNPRQHALAVHTGHGPLCLQGHGGGPGLHLTLRRPAWRGTCAWTAKPALPCWGAATRRPPTIFRIGPRRRRGKGMRILPGWPSQRRTLPRLEGRLR